jgi:hypothetical protein
MCGCVENHPEIMCHGKGCHCHDTDLFKLQPVWMDTGEMNRMKTAKKAVAEYLMTEYEFPVSAKDIYVVWFCKVLQNWKALLSTDLVNTGIYFEVTYNGDADELYLDYYIKDRNVAYKIEVD